MHKKVRVCETCIMDVDSDYTSSICRTDTSEGAFLQQQADRRQADARMKCLASETPTTHKATAACAGASPGRILRASRTSFAEVQALEQECAEISSMIEQSRNAGTRRSRAAQYFDTLEQVSLANAACQSPHQQAASASSAQADGLMQRAVRLRDTIAELASLVPDTMGSPISCGTPATAAGDAGDAASKLRGSANTAAPSRTDAVELATLRALTTHATCAPAADAKQSEQRMQAQSGTQAPARTSVENAFAAYHENDASLHNTAAASPQEAKAPEHAVNTSTAEGHLHKQSTAGEGQDRQAHAQCDAYALLSIVSLTGIPVLYQALALLEQQQESPGIWLSWRMPGASLRKAWCCLGGLADQEISRVPGQGFCIQYVQQAGQQVRFAASPAVSKLLLRLDTSCMRRAC